MRGRWGRFRFGPFSAGSLSGAGKRIVVDSDSVFARAGHYRLGAGADYTGIERGDPTGPERYLCWVCHGCVKPID
ncbi:TPA: hypothetical protein EYN98_10275 [Candidatus Poribacteria bacterium]|nr:hypothetical protein [Candidatus Poribacteria bacterium]HIA66426.1 hypothetical protein [Candidatus Poribacteria bacterium]HIC01430.1 hypothetical protein [Candidatus Poribacteria bacterium]